MQCSKLLTIAALTVASTLAMNAQAQSEHPPQPVVSTPKNVATTPKVELAGNQNASSVKASLTKSNNPNKVITDTLFPNASAQDKARIQDQIKKYSQLQYGFGTAAANPSPQKDGDIMTNIQSHDPATVKSQMTKMREAAQELPQLEKIQKTSNKP